MVKSCIGLAAWAVVLATIGVTVPARGDVFSNVTEALNYQLIYTLGIPNTATFNTVGNNVPYSIDNSASFTGQFDRIAYYMELQKPGDTSSAWVYASMDAFTTQVNKIGVPTLPSGATYQKNVKNMNVFSNVGTIATGTNLTGGNIEFWPNNYSAANAIGILNASTTLYDSGDTITTATPNGYGSMQIHNHLATATTAQTIFAYDHWGNGGTTKSDLGIGDNTVLASGQVNPDWTFRANASDYTIKNLQVLVHAGVPVPPPPSIKIMPMGDSITYGSGAAGGYRTQLYNSLTAAGLNVEFVGSATDNPSTTLGAAGQVNHEGHGGWRIDELAANLDANSGRTGNNGGFWFPGIAGTRDPINPDIILLHIGTNDFGQNFNITTAKDRLDALIAQLVADRPSAKVIVTNLLIRTDNTTTENNIESLFNPYVPGIVAAHQALGQKVYFLDMESKLDPATDLGDKLHPNQVGYNKMGDAFSAAVLAVVPEPSSVGVIAIAVLAGLARRGRRASL